MGRWEGNRDTDLRSETKTLEWRYQNVKLGDWKTPGLSPHSVIQLPGWPWASHSLFTKPTSLSCFENKNRRHLLEEEQDKNVINELTTRAIPTHSPRSPLRSRERQKINGEHICEQERKGLKKWPYFIFTTTNTIFFIQKATMEADNVAILFGGGWKRSKKEIPAFSVHACWFGHLDLSA